MSIFQPQSALTSPSSPISLLRHLSFVYQPQPHHLGLPVTSRDQAHLCSTSTETSTRDGNVLCVQQAMAGQREAAKARLDALRLRESYLEEVRVGISALESEANRKDSRLQRTRRSWDQDLKDRTKKLRDCEAEAERDERLLTGPPSLDERLNKATVVLDHCEKTMELRRSFIEIQRKYHAAVLDRRQREGLAVARRDRALAKRVARVEMLRNVGEQSFISFPSLPVELRLKVWSLVEIPYNEPRIHSIRGFPYSLLDSKKRDTNERLEHGPGIRHISRWKLEPEEHFDRVVFLSPHSIHPILHVCQESRSYALRKFDLTFEFETYINFKRDTIFLDRSSGISYEEYSNPGLLSAEELSNRCLAKSKVSSLAIHAFKDAELGVFKHLAAMFKSGLPKLEELIVVVSDDRQFERHGSMIERTGGNAMARDSVFVNISHSVHLSRQHQVWYEDSWKDIRRNCPKWRPPSLRHVWAST